MQNVKYNCPKCNHTQFETDTISATGGGLSRFLDIQNRRFISISCSSCGYTEFYKKQKGSTLESIFDALTT